MKVSDLAKEFNTTSAAILSELKTLKLKAKDSNQELNVVVVSVIKNHLKDKKLPKADEIKEEPKKIEKEVKAETKKEAKKPVKKKETKEKKEVKETKEKKLKEEIKTATKKTAEKTKTVKEKEDVKKQTVKSSKEKVVVEDKKEQVEEKKDVKVEEKIQKKTKSKISREPLITLKPFAHKKKRITLPRDGKDTNSTVAADAAQQADKHLEASDATDAGNLSTERAVDASLPDIEIKLPITVKDFSTKIQQKPSAVLKELMNMGLFAHINQSLDEGIVGKLTLKFGFNLAKIRTQEEQLIEFHKQEEDSPESLKPRAPVITFMGHVDHGKTSLLDRIRKSKIADAEHGGITQHMSAYSVNIDKGRITFLDTPGHEAFTSMRARGAHITDLVILVVAADEGIMPQTEEAIDHARAAGVPIVVALNKIDRKNADIDRVKKQLAEKDLGPEDWGGKTMVVPVSAITGEGIDDLLEAILLEAEILELRANADKKASGIVVEAHLSRGKGSVTTLIVQSGTLKDGDFIVIGPHYGKIRAMFNDHSKIVKEAGPSMPVEALGLSDVPEAGEMFYVVEDEKQARDISFRRQEQIKDKKLRSSTRITLEDLHAQIEAGAIKELCVILKSDVQGSLEALKDSLSKIPSDKVKLNFIHAGVGEVNTSDVVLAIASKAIIIAFHVGVDVRAKQETEKDPVDIREYRIIYDAVSDIRNALEGLLEAKIKKNFVGRAEIRQVFKLSKHGIIAGCIVSKGKISRKSKADIIRNGDIILSATISSLKRFKDDAKDVSEGMECGISVGGYTEYKVGDTIEAYEIESIAQKL
ncbi:MAG: translation initiation factor IF-2 [Candidatus Zapsychrus exili]|nr:translation initiation factor IF-2 [Candidatus Zapsychrus exili]